MTAVSLHEIDPAATRARLAAITTGGLRALDECARRSAQIDKQVKEMHERRTRAKQAMDERVKQAKESRRPAPRPSTLKLGAEELRETAQPTQARAPKPAAGVATRETGASSTGRTLRLGAEELRETAQAAPAPTGRTRELAATTDREEPPVKHKPKPRRPPAESDDDLSGRTWLR